MSRRALSTLWLLVLAVTGCGASAGPHAPPLTSAPSASPPLFEEGTTLESAVLAPPFSEEAGVAWEKEWIYSRYGRFRKKTVALASREGRRYDVITIELADHSEKVLYFDITDFYGK